MYYKKRYDRMHRVLHVGEYQRKDGSYGYRWTDMFGKRHCVYAKDLDALRIKEQKLQLDRLEGLKDAPPDLTVENVFETWIKLKRGIKGSTRSGYIQVFESLIRPAIGKKQVILMKRSNIRAFYLSLLDEKELSIGTLDNVHTVLHQVFQFAVDDDYLRKNPCDNMLKELKLSYGDRKRKKKNALTLQQEINFLKFVREDGRYWHLYPIFFIMLNTGLRAGELTGLRWKDIDLKNGIIDINHNLVYYYHGDESGYHYSISTPKTKNGIRKVIMTQAVIDAFHMERKFQEFLGLKSIDVIDGYKNFVFIGKNNHVQTYNKLNKIIENIITDYNKWIRSKGITDQNELLPHFSCHILRHTYATRLLESGAAIKFISAQMGHSDIQITYDNYIDVTDEFKRVQIKPFEKYMDSVLGDASSELTDLTGYIS